MGLLDSFTINSIIKRINVIIFALEDIINSNGGVDATNYSQVTQIIKVIQQEYRPLFELTYNMPVVKQSQIQVKWIDGSNLSFLEWQGLYITAINEAKQIVNQFQKTYD